MSINWRICERDKQRHPIRIVGFDADRLVARIEVEGAWQTQRYRWAVLSSKWSRGYGEDHAKRAAEEAYGASICFGSEETI